MMTWEQVREHVRPLQVSAEGPTWLRCGGDEGTVCLRLKELAGRPGKSCLEILVLVCAEQGLDHRRALLLGAALSAGALVLAGNAYVLRQLMALEAVSPTELDATLAYLTQVASELRSRAGPDVAAAAKCFTWYLE